MSKHPERIFIGPATDDDDGPSWTPHRVTSEDVEYVRADHLQSARLDDEGERGRAEGWREGMRQAVAFLREEADRREPHAEADALLVAADDLRVRAEKLGVG